MIGERAGGRVDASRQKTGATAPSVRRPWHKGDAFIANRTGTTRGPSAAAHSSSSSVSVRGTLQCSACRTSHGETWNSRRLRHHAEGLNSGCLSPVDGPRCQLKFL